MQVMVDFHACRWPSSIPTSHDTSIAEYFDNLNEPSLSNLAENLEMEEENTGRRSPLITFSHFLPLQVLSGTPRSGTPRCVHQCKAASCTMLDIFELP